MPHLFICHAHVTNVPYIIGTSVRDPYILVRPSPASYTTYRDQTRFFFTARSCVGHGVRYKELSAGLQIQFIETRTRHGHEVTARRSPSRLQTRSTTVCCQEKWSGKYLTYRTGGYGPVMTFRMTE